MAYEKLAISLEKQKRFEEAIKVCEDLLAHPSIPSPRSYLTKEDMMKRIERLKRKHTCYTRQVSKDL